MNLDKNIFGCLGIVSILAGAMMLADGDSIGGWPALLIGVAILWHVAFSNKL